MASLQRKDSSFVLFVLCWLSLKNYIIESIKTTNCSSEEYVNLRLAIVFCLGNISSLKEEEKKSLAGEISVPQIMC